ncbi:WD40 repeat domain-containing protein [Microcoleus sp. T2B6]|uniref:WD40 repeat domain-containing protein n=1 Tax=Microcoleus sp. T2B6 TaxID=3055424 RepID=UPI002FD2DC0B
MGEFADKLAAKPLVFQRACLGSLLPNSIKSGNLEKYYQALTNFDFLMVKIHHPEFGVQALIDDFNLVDDSESLNHPEYNPEKAKALNLIQRVLWMSADIWEQDKTQLAGQLLGRLLHFNIPTIQAMSEIAKDWKATPWLRPLTPCLSPPRRGWLRTLLGHSRSVNAVAVTADNKRVISGSLDKTLKVWDLTIGKEIFALKGHSSSVNAVAVTADGKRAISGSLDKTLKVWDLTTGEELLTLKGHSSSVNAVAVTADGKRAISGSHDNIKVWDLTTGKEEFTLQGQSILVNAVAVTADGKRVISGSLDNTVKVWDLTTGKEKRGLLAFVGKSLINSSELFTLKGHSERVNAVAVTADGKQAISASSDKTLKVWDLTTGDEIFTLEGHSRSVNAVAVTKDGLAISASSDKTLKGWDLKTGSQLFTVEAHSNWVNAVAFTADGKRAISASSDKTLNVWDFTKVWDLTTEDELFTLKAHSGSVKAVGVTADGKRAISSSHDNIKVWDLTTGKEEFTLGKEEFTLEGHGNSKSLYVTYKVAVTPDRKRAIAGSSDNTLKVWDLTTVKEEFTLKVRDLTTGKEEFTLTGRSYSVNAVSVTADGRSRISGSSDNTLKVWDLNTGNVIASFTGESPIACCAIAPDGVTIVAGARSGRVYFLRLQGMEELT